MTRRSDLETADTTHVAAIAVYEAIPDKAKKPDQWRKLAVNQRSLLHIREELAKLGPDTPPPAPPPVVEPPVIPGDAASKAKAWNHLEAAAAMDGAVEHAGYQPITTDQWLEVLGAGLFGQKVALGEFGGPDEHEITPEQYALADPYGGYWGTRSGIDHLVVYGASKVLGVLGPPNPATVEDARKFWTGLGLNFNGDGPA